MRLTLASASIAALAILAGCSSTPPPTADGAWSVQLEQCSLIANGTTAFGTIDQSSHAMTMTDQLNSASVNCSVAPSGSGFSVNATAKGGADSLFIKIPSISTSASPTSGAVGQVSFASQLTADNAYESNNCTFYFTTGTPETVSSTATGTIFVAFTCPTLSDTSQGATCKLNQGYAFFENCLTSN
jgi:hypothetical protein